jgi:hypothetical protein
MNEFGGDRTLEFVRRASQGADHALTLSSFCVAGSGVEP